jgi:O-succinylbenzoic acid--CoA ligase
VLLETLAGRAGDAVGSVATRGPRGAAGRGPGARHPRAAGEAGGAGEPDPDAPAVAVLTSGTTGQPRVALLSHAALAASAAAWSEALPPATGWLLCLGLAHVAGLGVAWRSIGAGLPLRVVPAFDAAAVLAALRDGPPSHVSLVPTQLARLLDADASGDPTHRGLRAVLLGGGPVPPALVTRALAAGWPVVPTYGLTEAASGVTALATAEAAARPGSAGRPLPGVALRIADAAADGGGEIEVSTPAAFSGYLGRPEATAAAFTADGWLRTGDAGSLDADGFLHVLDRRDDLLVSGGENVVPAEVEAAIEEHPAIAEAGVVGRTDPTWGAVPVAAVVPRPGVPAPTKAELRAFCLARLAPYKVPVAFIVVAALPRTASGKLRRAELRATLTAALRADGVEVPG